MLPKLKLLDKGDHVMIRGEVFVVLYVQQEAELDVEKRQEKKYLAVYLHDIRHRVISPKYKLKCYLGAGRECILHGPRKCMKLHKHEIKC